MAQTATDVEAMQHCANGVDRRAVATLGQHSSRWYRLMQTPSSPAPKQLDLTRTLELTPDEHAELRLWRSGGNGPIGLEGNPASGLVWGGMDDSVSVVRVRAGGALVSTVFTK